MQASFDFRAVTDRLKLSPVETDPGINTGLMYFNYGRGLASQRTIMVIGPPRSGTTMVARVLTALGVPMGVEIGSNYEDVEFVDLLHATHSGNIDKKRLTTLIDKHNQEHDIWGFKVPMAISSLMLLDGKLRNPYFVFIFRDLLAAGMRSKIASCDDDMFGVMRYYNLLYSKVLDFLGHTKSPGLLVSYEKAILHPKLFTTNLAKFAGMEPSLEAMIQIQADNPEYLGLEQELEAVTPVVA